jgi:NAD(P)-dependent dehydrogenase (short-subunit alcohol dehydrogenase family)
MKRFAGKAVLVTGGGSGMGRATAELLAQRGASVCVMGRRADKLDDVVRAICHEGGQALAVQGDTSKPEDVENALARTVAEFGALHYALTMPVFPALSCRRRTCLLMSGDTRSPSTSTAFSTD